MMRLLKAIFLFLSIFLCIFVLAFLRCLFMFSPVRKKTLVAHTVYIFSRIFALILGIKVELCGQKKLLKK